MWRADYNTERPHEAIGMQVPSDLYERSPRVFHGDVELAYPPEYQVRIVNSRGVLHHKGRRIFISNVFNGYKLGLKSVNVTVIEVYFANWKFGSINRTEYLFTPAESIGTISPEQKPLPGN